ncbi:MAG: phenylalanine--tRNA ligase subunit alpha, partial [Ruminococcus sp.]|nr:phenylalanine--tRNA ligase subunit alpha [Ruminococcus sp.]
MSEKMNEIKKAFAEKLKNAVNTQALEEIRIEYLGKKGSVTGLMKTMKELSGEEKKTFGQQVNVLKNEITQAISEKLGQIKQKELEAEINSVPDFDLSAPPVLDRGSYHPITLVQRECEQVFRSMGFAIEEYSEIVTDYECFEALNIPKHHPARDMQDTYYLTNGQLLKSHTSAAQNAIYKKYRKALIEDGKPIKAIFPGRCFRNEATDACHENTFFQMEGVM